MNVMFYVTEDLIIRHSLQSADDKSLNIFLFYQQLLYFFIFFHLVVAAWCQRSCKARRSLSESNPVTDHLLLLSVGHISLGTVCTS